jgi:hypothetical protein
MCPVRIQPLIPVSLETDVAPLVAMRTMTMIAALFAGCDDGNWCTTGNTLGGSAAGCNLICTQTPNDCGCTLANGCIKGVTGTVEFEGDQTDRVNSASNTNDSSLTTYQGGSSSLSGSGGNVCSTTVTTSYTLASPTTLGSITLVAKSGGSGDLGAWEMNIDVVDSNGTVTAVYDTNGALLGSDVENVNITINDTAPWENVETINVTVLGYGSGANGCKSYAFNYETSLFVDN